LASDGWFVKQYEHGQYRPNICDSAVRWQPAFPFAQILSSFEQLQQSNPSQYQQVTQQIAKNLENAAKTAQSEGDPTAANQLKQPARLY
jgi:hypothetical protein